MFRLIDIDCRIAVAAQRGIACTIGEVLQVCVARPYVINSILFQIESAIGPGSGVMGIFYMQHGPDWSVVSGNTSGITQVGLSAQSMYVLHFC